MLGLQRFEDQTQCFDNSRQTCCWLSYSPSSLLPALRCFSPLWLSSDPVRLHSRESLSYLRLRLPPLFTGLSISESLSLSSASSDSSSLSSECRSFMIYLKGPEERHGPQAVKQTLPTHLTILDTGDTCSADHHPTQLRLCKQIRDTFQITISTLTLLISS